MNTKTALLGLISLILVSLIGCSQDPRQGYTNQNLHQQDIDSVFVEMFGNQSFRRDIEYDLTRAVALQLSNRTPYRIVKSRNIADTVLYGTILNIKENTLTQQRDIDRPIQNQISITVEINWKDLRNGKMLLETLKIRTDGTYAVLMGENRFSANSQAVEDMAERIVEAMEYQW